MPNGFYQFLADRHRVLLRLLAFGVEDSGTLFHQLPFPVADQGLVDFELGGELVELFLALDRRYGDLELELLGVVLPRAFSQLISPSQHQDDKLTALSSPVGPL